MGIVGHEGEPSTSVRMTVAVRALDEAPSAAEGLTVQEKSHAATLPDPQRRARFILSRAMRRQILAECTGLAAGDLRFDEPRGEKPRLVGRPGWDFNTSHSGEYVAVAVGRQQVGVDLERVRPVRDFEGLARRYFHPDEVAAWLAIPDEDRLDAFFLLWAAREAAVKCAGCGLARGLALTRVDPLILSSGRSAATVGLLAIELQRREAPAGYVLITACA